MPRPEREEETRGPRGHLEAEMPRSRVWKVLSHCGSLGASWGRKYEGHRGCRGGHPRLPTCAVGCPLVIPEDSQRRGAPWEGPFGASDKQKESLACDECSGPVPRDTGLCRELQGLGPHKLTEGGGRDRLAPITPAEQRKVSAGTVTSPPHTWEGRTGCWWRPTQNVVPYG